MQTLIAHENPTLDSLAQALETSCQALPAQAGRIILRGGESAYAAVGVWTDDMPLLDSAINAQVYEHGRTDVSELTHKSLQGRLSHFVALPLSARGRYLGVLWFGFAAKPTLSEEQSLFLDMLAVNLSGAIASLQRLERHLQNETYQLRYDSVLESQKDALVVMDRQQIVRYMNPSACQILGINLEDALGVGIASLVKDEALQKFMRQANELEAGRFLWPHEEQTYQPFILPFVVDGVKQGQLLLLRDVSNFRRQHENMTLFLQTVSHDLRSPLTAAKGFVDMMPMVGELNEKQLSMKEKILISIVDMTNLVEKVLDAGRLDPEVGAYQLRREICDPTTLVEKVVSTLNTAAAKKNLVLRADIDNGVPALNLDEMMIERALTNLVENAIKYTPEGGEIVVKVYVKDHHLHLAVVDNGFGIPEDKQASIFDKGSRIRRVEHRTIRGSGLGLFIVKNVAQQHGGDALLSSTEGEGSQFEIVIPIAGQNVVGASS